MAEYLKPIPGNQLYILPFFSYLVVQSYLHLVNDFRRQLPEVKSDKSMNSASTVC